jgi:hypothetical protein
MDHVGHLETLGQGWMTGHQNNNPPAKKDACWISCHKCECNPSSNIPGMCHPITVIVAATPGKRLPFELFEILVCCGMFTNSSCVPTCKICAERRRRPRIFANRESQTCYADRVCVSWRSSRYGSGSGLPLTNPLAFRDSANRQESEEFTSPNRSATPNCEN